MSGASDLLTMKATSRKTFVKTVAFSLAASVLENPYMNASPLNLPIGLQLYTVGDDMDRDAAGTAKAVAAAGYKQVELSPLSKTPAKDLKKALDDAGLKNPSGHYMLPDLMGNLPEKIDFAHQFGQEFIVVTVPWA